jgi:hypothetical protein
MSEFTRPMTKEEAAEAARMMQEQPARDTVMYAAGVCTPDSGLEGPDALALATLLAVRDYVMAGGIVTDVAICTVDTRAELFGVAGELMTGVKVVVKGRYRGVQS